MTDPAAGPAWSGWGAGSQNARFQTASAAGLTADQVSKLKLRWAFGVPNAAEMHSQPTVASGRVFFGSDAAYLYSLDAKTGCVHWSFQADAGIRSAPTVTAIKGQGSTRYAVYFVDVLTRVYALDAQTGRLLWKVKAGDHLRMLYVPRPCRRARCKHGTANLADLRYPGRAAAQREEQERSDPMGPIRRSRVERANNRYQTQTSLYWNGKRVHVARR